MIASVKYIIAHSSLAKTYLKDILKSVAKQYYVTEAERVNIKVVKSLQLPKIMLTKIANIARKSIFNKADESKKKGDFNSIRLWA